MADRPKAHREVTRADLEARHKAEARFADSDLGMRATAADLRRRATEMVDSNDRDVMFRLALDYEKRADDALGRFKRSR